MTDGNFSSAVDFRPMLSDRPFYNVHFIYFFIEYGIQYGTFSICLVYAVLMFVAVIQISAMGGYALYCLEMTFYEKDLCLWVVFQLFALPVDGICPWKRFLLFFS